MVDIDSNNERIQIVLSPNRSMSWDDNKKILAALFLVNMTIAIGWSMMGAWMVLPFAGLEVLLVGIGFYYVSWKLSFKEIITLQSGELLLQKGVYFPKQEWSWPLQETTLIKQPSNYRMSPPTLYLTCRDQRIEIGGFLNRTEKTKVRESLRKHGVVVNTLSRS